MKLTDVIAQADISEKMRWELNYKLAYKLANNEKIMWNDDQFKTVEAGETYARMAVQPAIKCPSKEFTEFMAKMNAEKALAFPKK